MASSHYDVLGVDQDAPADDIRRAYRRLALRLHPDRQPFADAATMAEAHHRMALVAAAYAVLADPSRRRAYDLALGQLLNAPTSSQAAPQSHEAEPDGPEGERFDRLGLDDEEDGIGPGARHPADLVLMVPATLAAMAVATFVVAVMVQSHALWALAILLAPVAGVAFLAAPLFSMHRSRQREA